MKCKNLLKYGWKGEKTFNRGDKSKFLFSVQSSRLPLTLYYRKNKKVEEITVTREMLEKMDDNRFRKTGFFLGKTWITKHGIEECGGDIIASVEVEGGENWDGYFAQGYIEINYECNKCNSSLPVFSNIWIERVGHQKLLPEVITTVEELNDLLTKHIERM